MQGGAAPLRTPAPAGLPPRAAKPPFLTLLFTPNLVCCLGFYCLGFDVSFLCIPCFIHLIQRTQKTPIRVQKNFSVCKTQVVIPMRILFRQTKVTSGAFLRFLSPCPRPQFFCRLRRRRLAFGHKPFFELVVTIVMACVGKKLKCIYV